jgi:hypothetical protein
MVDEKENRKKETLAFCRETCSKSMKLLIGHLVLEGVPKEKLMRALKSTEAELEPMITAVHTECTRSRQKDDQNRILEAMRKDYLTRVLVHYLKESNSFDNAVYFPRQSLKIFSEAVRKMLGEIIMEEKQLQCYAVVKDYQDESGRINWEGVYVDDRAKQITWDVLCRISLALSGVTGEWFRNYIADYAKTQGGFYGEGMATYIQERLESIAKTFRPG